MLSLFHDYEHPVKVAIALLDKLNVTFTRVAVHEELQKHPDYPSLFSISALLTQRNIANAALEVDPENLYQLPTPFIAHTKTAGGSFVLITSVNGTVKYVNERGKEKEKPVDAFLNEWTNKVLLAETTLASGEKNYRVNRRKELFSVFRIPAIILVCVALVLLYTVRHAFEANVLWLSGLLLLKLGGAVVSALLIWFEIDKYNPALQNVCSSGKKINCGAVLDSKHARLFNAVSWSEIGFFYFAAGFLSLLLAPAASATVGVLAWMNVLAVPYTLFSVGYQWRIARQWCLLCLIVQGLLITEALVFALTYWYADAAPLAYAGAFYPVVALALVVLFWVFVKPALTASQRTERLTRESSRIKYKPEVFDSLLRAQRPITVSTEGLGITLGNPQAKHTLVKVCSPYCGPCATAHHELHELLDNNPDIKLQIIFTVTNNEQDMRFPPVKHLMTLYDGTDTALIRRALDDWYSKGKKDYHGFLARYTVFGEQKPQHAQIIAMEQWCAAMNIHATPTFFIDGFELPKEYTLADLKYLFG